MKTKTGKMVNFIFGFIITATFIVAMIITSCEKVKDNAPTAPTMAETTEQIVEQKETETVETEPPMTLYNIPLDEDLQIHIIEKAQENGIDPVIIFSMAKIESNYKPDAINKNSKAYGMMQIRVRWHYDRMLRLGCTDLLDPYDNVTVAIDYLAEQLNRYGSIEKALTAYNKGHYSGTITNYAKSVKAIAKGLSDETYVYYR